MRLIDRLHKYLELRGISAYEFERTCELSNGYLGKQLKGKGSVGSDILEKIGEQYPELNLVWLITGKGKMQVNPSRDKKETESTGLELSDAEAVYQVRDKLIEMLKEQLDVLSTSGPGKKKRKKKA